MVAYAVLAFSFNIKAVIPTAPPLEGEGDILFIPPLVLIDDLLLG